MIDRRLLKAGDICLVRDPGDLVGRVIDIGQWGTSRSPEFAHVFMVRDETTAAETNPPHPRIFNLSEYDDRFDKGQVCIMRNKNLDDLGRLQLLAWLDAHQGTAFPYGWGLIALFGLDNLVTRFVLDKAGEWLKGQPVLLDYVHRPECATYVWMALCAGLGESVTDGKDFAEKYKIGRGRITPGDFYGMKQDFQVVQDKS